MEVVNFTLNRVKYSIQTIKNLNLIPLGNVHNALEIKRVQDGQSIFLLDDNNMICNNKLAGNMKDAVFHKEELSDISRQQKHYHENNGLQLYLITEIFKDTRYPDTVFFRMQDFNNKYELILAKDSTSYQFMDKNFINALQESSDYKITIAKQHILAFSYSDHEIYFINDSDTIANIYSMINMYFNEIKINKKERLLELIKGNISFFKEYYDSSRITRFPYGAYGVQNEQTGKEFNVFKHIDLKDLENIVSDIRTPFTFLTKNKAIRFLENTHNLVFEKRNYTSSEVEALAFENKILIFIIRNGKSRYEDNDFKDLTDVNTYLEDNRITEENFWLFELLENKVDKELKDKISTYRKKLKR